METDTRLNPGQDAHVHFPAEQLQQHDSEILVSPYEDGRINVHLGFLQYKHHYEVQFSTKDPLGEDLVADPLQNLHCKVLDVMPSEDGEGHDFVIDLAAHKEKLQKEELVLKDNSDPSKQLTITINARVLGKGKGTPSLKTGIKCTGIDVDEDSEQSDWQGFE